MPYNGSGGFTRIRNWVADATAGTKIRADFHDSEDDNFASGLSNALCKDGQSSPTADIGFNAKKITGLADPVNDQDAVTKKYMLGGAVTQGLWTKLGFASADMSILGRTADGGATPPTKQRIAFNDKADGTGNDVFAINDDGTFKTSVAPVLSAETRNRIINGAMQISQEWGDGGSTGNAFYAADQWVRYWSTTGTITTQRIATVTPNGSKYRLVTAITVADAALAAGDLVEIVQNVEGVRVADFRYGSASAKQTVLRFGWKSPAGTYSVNIGNSAANRSYIANFTITAGQANTNTEQVIVIPGDTTGAWLTDTGKGLVIQFVIAAGTTYQGVAGWQAGNFLVTASNTNGMATIGSVFEIFDVGLYLDPNATGVAPRWVMPDEAEELRACQRYWQPMTMDLVGYASTGGQFFGAQYVFPVSMRVTPALTTDSNGALTNAASAAFDSPTTIKCRAVMSSTAGGTYASAGRTGVANARM